MGLHVFTQPSLQLSHEGFAKHGFAWGQSPGPDVAFVEDPAEVRAGFCFADRHLHQVHFGGTPGTEAPVHDSGDPPPLSRIFFDEQIAEMCVSMQERR